MEYQRYKPKRPRPFGMGPFFDYVLEVTKRLAAPLPRVSRWRKKRLLEAEAPVDEVAEKDEHHRGRHGE